VGRLHGLPIRQVGRAGPTSSPAIAAETIRTDPVPTRGVGRHTGWRFLPNRIAVGAAHPTERLEGIPMSERIIMRTGEALVEGAEDYLCAEPEVVIGELDGPVGHALASLIGDQVKGHSRVFAILNSDVQVKPATVMVSKVTVKSGKYTNILMGTVQAAIAHGILNAVRSGDIPRDKVDDLGIIYSVWLDPAVLDADELDHKALFDVHREATAKVIRKAMRREPTIDWLLENQGEVTHYFHDLGVKGEL
jgi:formaldehyde-activating enzyme